MEVIFSGKDLVIYKVFDVNDPEYRDLCIKYPNKWALSAVSTLTTEVSRRRFFELYTKLSPLFIFIKEDKMYGIVKMGEKELFGCNQDSVPLRRDENTKNLYTEKTPTYLEVTGYNYEQLLEFITIQSKDYTPVRYPETEKISKGINQSTVVYLSTPYTHPDPDVVKDRFEKTCLYAKKLIDEGYVVLSPILMYLPLAERFNLDTAYKNWETTCSTILHRCDILAVADIDGWKESVGIESELKMASNIGLELLMAKIVDEKIQLTKFSKN